MLITATLAAALIPCALWHALARLIALAAPEPKAQ